MARTTTTTTTTSPHLIYLYFLICLQFRFFTIFHFLFLFICLYCSILNTVFRIFCLCSPSTPTLRPPHPGNPRRLIFFQLGGCRTNHWGRLPTPPPSTYHHHHHYHRHQQQQQQSGCTLPHPHQIPLCNIPVRMKIPELRNTTLLLTCYHCAKP